MSDHKVLVDNGTEGDLSPREFKILDNLGLIYACDECDPATEGEEIYHLDYLAERFPSSGRMA